MRKTKAERETEALECQAKETMARLHRNVVDELGALDVELAPTRAKQRRFDALAKVVRFWHANADPEATQVSVGDRYEVILDIVGMETHFPPMAEVYRVLGHDKFLAAASVTLTALEKNTDPATIASLTHKERTGSRKLVVRALPLAKAA